MIRKVFRRALVVCTTLMVTAAFALPGVSWSAPAAQPVGTLVPPTLVPQPPTAIPAAATESALARVQREGILRVGLLYNAPPFSVLNIRGELEGFEADLARAIAETWEVELEPVQVTRQTALALLQNQTVDMLMASQVHRRDLDSQFEFSQTYYLDNQAMMVRADDAATRPADLANRRVGYVLGGPSLEAISLWQQRSGIGVTLVPMLSLEQGLAMLRAGEVDGVVDNRVSLVRLLNPPDLAKLLEEPVSPEPLAVVLRRQDVNARNFINRTLQHLVNTGRIAELLRANNLPSNLNPIDLLPVWANLGEAPTPGDVPADLTLPVQYTLPRLQQAGRLRVAGAREILADALESERRLDAVNRAVVEAMAARWGMTVEYVPGSENEPAALVANGQADIAMGVTLDWDLVGQVDLTAAYLLHGDRIMAEVGSPYETFLDLRARFVAVFASEPGAGDRVNELARSVNSGVRIFVLNREQEAADLLLNSNNADVIFGDSLKLIAHVQANPDRLRLTRRGSSPDPWYTRRYVGFAVQRNDLEFRLLVEYTLQEMARNGQLAALLGSVTLPEDVRPFDIWPGVSDYLGFRLG